MNYYNIISSLRCPLECYILGQHKQQWQISLEGFCHAKYHLRSACNKFRHIISLSLMTRTGIITLKSENYLKQWGCTRLWDHGEGRMVKFSWTLHCSLWYHIVALLCLRSNCFIPLNYCLSSYVVLSLNENE